MRCVFIRLRLRFKGNSGLLHLGSHFSQLWPLFISVIITLYSQKSLPSSGNKNHYNENQWEKQRNDVKHRQELHCVFFFRSCLCGCLHLHHYVNLFSVCAIELMKTTHQLILTIRQKA